MSESRSEAFLVVSTKLFVLTHNFLLTYLDLNTATAPSVMDLVQESLTIVRADCKTFSLQRLYKFLNERVFHGRLPTDLPVIWVHTFIKTIACNRIRGVERSRIGISHDYLRYHPSRKVLLGVILHEMCHVQQAIDQPQELEHHGPYFMRLMTEYNDTFGNLIQVTFDDDYMRSVRLSFHIYRWACNKRACDFLITDYRNMPVTDAQLEDHSLTCNGVVKLLSFPRAIKFIKRVVNAERTVVRPLDAADTVIAFIRSIVHKTERGKKQKRDREFAWRCQGGVAEVPL